MTKQLKLIQKLDQNRKPFDFCMQHNSSAIKNKVYLHFNCRSKNLTYVNTNIILSTASFYQFT